MWRRHISRYFPYNLYDATFINFSNVPFNITKKQPIILKVKSPLVQQINAW